MKAQFCDNLLIFAKAGKGGDGSASFRRESHVPEGGPDGGDGGRGGHVIVRGSRHENNLIKLFYSPRLVAEDGVNGNSQKRTGRAGRDFIIDVPCGTLVIDEDSGLEVCDITADGQMEIIARGGNGGLGNVHWKTATNRAPTQHTDGEAGEERNLRFELRVIADAGFVGFPNAGKSSLLAALTSATPKIGAYPFTTLNPVVGALQFTDGASLTLADIPGIINGASEGIGLGHDFLRHIARARVFIIVLDTAGTDGRTPWEDYRALQKELKAFNPEFADRPMLIVANKVDSPESAANLTSLRRRIRRKVIPVSAATGEGLDKLKEALRDLLKPTPQRPEYFAQRFAREN